MCDVCKAYGKDPAFVNGSKKGLYSEKLYRVFKDNIADIRLCHVHSIELFMYGERRFIASHLIFARSLASKAKKRDPFDSLYA